MSGLAEVAVLKFGLILNGVVLPQMVKSAPRSGLGPAVPKSQPGVNEISSMAKSTALLQPVVVVF